MPASCTPGNDTNPVTPSRRAVCRGEAERAGTCRRLGNSSPSVFRLGTQSHLQHGVRADDGSNTDNKQGWREVLLDLLQGFGGQLVNPGVERPGDCHHVLALLEPVFVSRSHGNQTEQTDDGRLNEYGKIRTLLSTATRRFVSQRRANRFSHQLGDF